DLANVMNEAALLSARQQDPAISMAMLEQAVERATWGVARPHVMSDEERRAVAVHEAGHVLVALDTEEGSLPHMVSIIPAGKTLGRAWLTDTHDRVSRSRSALIEDMAILLGGRAAEEIVFGQVTTSAANDLSHVGRIANRMVRELGMSDAVGPIAYPGDSEEDGAAPPLSDDTARLIDLEARRLVSEAQDRAHQVLTNSRVALERLTAALLEAETLDAAHIKQIVAEPERAPA
ncbi:MAG TPA: cell division protein FtsH, partial [Solirubrobacteraceae bacterium]|nr:cell division protein FtsH [Solirubrobacteraceae bacterium]